VRVRGSSNSLKECIITVDSENPHVIVVLSVCVRVCVCVWMFVCVWVGARDTQAGRCVRSAHWEGVAIMIDFVYVFKVAQNF